VLPESDHPREACGVFGIFSPGDDVARFTFYGLYALQHRGQESAGIATSDGERFELRTGMGLVSQVFDEEDLAILKGHIAIGHTRYSTSGGSLACNAQPIVVKDTITGEPIALAHNGNLTNADVLRDDLLAQGVEFESTADSEIIAHLLARAPGITWQERFHNLMRRLEGAYSLVIMTRKQLFAVRDPMGVRPLCIGKIGAHGHVAASETCALEHLGLTMEREIEPGEVVKIDHTGAVSAFPMAVAHQKRALCTFEYTYFARPDSILGGQLIYRTREEMGAQLAREHPVDADIVIGVPDSSIPAAIGYARESAIPYREGLVKNRYVGRTFIQPDQRIREAGVSLKFNALSEVLRGKRIVVVDDSIVRGTTTPHVVGLLRRAGAREVHMRISTPPIMWPCFLGVDMATKSELIAANNSIEEIGEFVGADSLGYLSLEGLNRSTRQPEQDLCNACFTGVYPLNVQMQMAHMEAARSREPELVIRA
jgi:amidophosphoribosyltransferase